MTTTLTLDAGGPWIAALVDDNLDLAIAQAFDTDATGHVQVPGAYQPYLTAVKAHWNDLVARQYPGALRHFQVVVTLVDIDDHSTPPEVVTVQITTSATPGNTDPSGTLA